MRPGARGEDIGADQSRYEKGDRVWVLRGYGSRRPGVVIGYYVDWGLYRIVYMVDIMQQD